MEAEVKLCFSESLKNGDIRRCITSTGSLTEGKDGFVFHFVSASLASENQALHFR